jgi:hypothetical protein
MAADQGHAATGDDTLFDGGTGRVQRVFHAGLLLLHLGLGGGTDVDDGHAAGELGQALLELLAVVVGGGLFDLAADLADAALDVGGLAAPSTMVVLSLSMVTSWRGRGRPDWMLSSLMPRSSEMNLPPVRMAMSSSMALRRSPKPGAFTARS